MKIILSIAALAAASFSMPAQAQGQESRSQTVSIADLDLGTDAGQTSLDRRLRAAVKTACGTASDVHPKGKNEVRRCRVATKARAERQRQIAVASGERKSATKYAAEH